LNDLRWCGSLKKTREVTERSELAIDRLCLEGLQPSVIVTLHRLNASTARLPILEDWLLHLDRVGVLSTRLHLLESENVAVRSRFALSEADNVWAMLGFAKLEAQLLRMKLDVFRDIEALLLGEDDAATCVWMACDPLTTEAVRGVEGHGQRSNCGRTNKSGIDFVKAERPGYERYIALYQTPQVDGGCQGCRFFAMCKGQCPGTSLDGDWRNRTEHCSIWMRLFEAIERRLLSAGRSPLSLDPNLRYLEENLLNTWTAGKNRSLASLLRTMRSAHATEQTTVVP